MPQQDVQKLKWRSVFLTLLSVVFLISARIAVAQVPNDYQIGMPPHADFSGTDFENVQVNNNNLHIEVPIWSMPGRGPSTGYKYIYDSKGWDFLEHCNPISGYCSDRVEP